MTTFSRSVVTMDSDDSKGAKSATISDSQELDHLATEVRAFKTQKRVHVSLKFCLSLISPIVIHGSGDFNSKMEMK